MNEELNRLFDESNLDERTVQMYERRLRDGESLPAVVLWDDNGQHKVIDGLHRIEAMKRCGMTDISGFYLVSASPDRVPDLRRKLNHHDDN